MGTTNVRQMNIYRNFSLQHGVSQRDKFNYQLDLIHNALTPSTLLLRDLNLDWTKRHNQNYGSKNYFTDMEEKLGNHNLKQRVDFIT